ncbi:MAG TPA: hypothetical protein PLT66_09230, partial [Bacillota bacterium]|nr:hypothetical protein [Bacillota bacterium]
KNQIYYSVFLALLTIAVHSLLNTLTNTVLSDALPQIMLPSYYTIAYLFNLISYIFFVVLFMLKYDKITFTTITKNKWYLLVKMGTDPNKLLIFKTFNTLKSVVSIYLLGYALALVFAIFFKYTFIIGYLISLLIAGLADILLLVWGVMLMSVFVPNSRKAGLFTLLIAALQLILKYATGFMTLTSNRAEMTDIANIFRVSKSPYLVIMLSLIVVCMCGAMIIAKYKSSFYFTAKDSKDSARLDYKTKKLLLAKTGNNKAGKIAAVCLKAALAVIITTAVAANAFVLVMSLSSSTDEFSVYGYIPYIFQSTTMEDEIYRNDLIIFRRVDTAMPVDEGKTVIYELDSTVYIEKIISVEGSSYTVDITNYPKGTDGDELLMTVDRGAIYGELTYTNRWLGA